MEPDFSGYVTKAGVLCSDGRVITDKAFEHMDGQWVPLMWAHRHDDPENLLGRVLLEHRDSSHPEGAGMYGYGFFNGSPKAQHTKFAVEEKNINSMSIFANQLKEQVYNNAKNVIHGIIREVSLVLAGANKDAVIDFVAVRHSYGETEIFDDAADIYMNQPLELSHSEIPVELMEKAGLEEEPGTEVEEAEPEETEEEVVEEETEEEVEHTLSDDDVATLASFNDDQLDFMTRIVDQALREGGSAQHTDSNDPEQQLTHQEGDEMSRNIFEQAEKGLAHDAVAKDGKELKHEWTPDAMSELKELWKSKGTLSHALQEYALAHGIENLESLFPEPVDLDGRPQWISREMSWVTGVLAGVTNTPRSRVKSRFADITQPEARARGYIKGEYKKEEWFSLMHRSTTPTTVYKKQVLDRDDVLDASDWDIIAWMKGEMQLMLREELARAILFGDGREIDDPDKIKDPIGTAEMGVGIRSIANDDELFVTTLWIDDAINAPGYDYEDMVKTVLRGRRFHKGTGLPTLYTTEERLTEMLLTEDGYERRRYDDVPALAKAMRLRDIVACEVLEEEVYSDIIGVIVNLADYTTGSDKGGEVTLFDDFNLDYNKEIRLIETRLCGALTKWKAATVLRVGEGTLVTPTEPTFDPVTGELTIPTVTGVVYKHGVTTVDAAGSPYDVPAGTTWTITASPASGSYYFADSEHDSWDFTADE